MSATLTVVATVTGASWSTVCGTAQSGSSWYRVSAVNGTPVSTTYGVTYLYAATGVLKAVADAPSLGPSVTFYGRGWGHGVGMSQYGARGRALAGQNSATILAHYFQGTTLGTVATGSNIRVLVLDDLTPTPTTPLTIYSRGAGATIAGLDIALPLDARLRLIPTTTGTGTTWRLIVDQAGLVLADVPAPADLRVAGVGDAATLQLWSKPSYYDLYRGTLRIILTGARADVISELPLESYLRGVVPAEMPSAWPTEALRAQAIAARSYAAVRLRPGINTFDAYDDTRSQVYLGVRRETATTDAVIAATANQVLRSGSAIANAMFHSTGGGATENNEYAFVGSSGAVTNGRVSYLRGSPDRDPSGAAYDATSPYASWQTKASSLTVLSTIFGGDSRTDVGGLTGLDLTNRGVSGRLISVTLRGSTGVKTVSGNLFVSIFNARNPAGDPDLRSALFDVTPLR